MTDQPIRNVTLADRTFPVPMLPPIANRIVLPLCHKLSDLVKRTTEAGGVFAPTTEEYDDTMTAIAAAVSFGSPDVTKEDLMLLAMKPQQQFDALLAIRLQTGGWTTAKPGEDTGEA